MRVWKLILLGLSILGVVLCCGCVSENSGTGKQVEVQGQVTTTSGGGQTSNVATTNEKVEGEKQTSQNSQVEGKLPPWAEKYLPRANRNYSYSIWKILQIENNGVKCKAEFLRGCGFGYNSYHPNHVYEIDLVPSYASLTYPIKDTFNAFLKANGVNLFNVLTNDTLKQKYEEKYQEYLKIANESLKWENHELDGKELVILTCWLDSNKVENISNYPYPGVFLAWYVIYDNGKDLTYEALKRGYAFCNEKYLKGFYQSAVANNYTETANYLKKYLDAQEYAKEHKLGVWSIDLSDLKK
jgi:hypothetical protein